MLFSIIYKESKATVGTGSWDVRYAGNGADNFFLAVETVQIFFENLKFLFWKKIIKILISFSDLKNINSMDFGGIFIFLKFKYFSDDLI